MDQIIILEKTKIIKLWEEIIGKKLHDSRLGNNFLDVTQKHNQQK